ncbi:MAG: D-glycerate dehydrogenase [Kiloniellales bacterium]|jgi:lactate dehydrogenase-like 2-hydroxyacid dehydrogenase|nr:D-glycerate dehydrogenase [Kiloniellales bacterium]
MSAPRLIVTRRWPEEVERVLEESYDVTLNAEDRPFTAEELQAAFRDYDAVLPTVSDRITAEVMSAEPMTARLVGNFGVGFNHIDIEAAKARGLTVTNTPDVLTDCTADLAMTLLLGVARRAGEGERHLRAGEWSGWRPTHMMGTKVTGKTLGLIGFGRIGKAVAERAHFGFGMRILFYDAYPPAAEAVAAVKAESCASVEEVLERADFVSLHCPGSAENRHLINAERLSAMQPHAFLINTARGDIVEEAALVAALKAGTIAGAGLDVYEFEPKVSPDLAGLDNVLLLPHLGSATRETRVAMGMRVVDNVRAFFAGEPPPDRVA